MVWIHLADKREAALEAYHAIRVAAGFPVEDKAFAPVEPMTVGTIDQAAEAIRAYEAIGVDELLIQMHEPYDFATLERLPELRARLEVR